MAEKINIRKLEAVLWESADLLSDIQIVAPRGATIVMDRFKYALPLRSGKI